MPMELRKRNTPAATPAPAATKKTDGKVKKSTAGKAKPLEKVKAAIKGEKAGAAATEAEKEEKEKSPKAEKAEKAEKKAGGASGKEVGDIIEAEGFGGEVQINDGETTTLKELLEKSGDGVVLFTYPKASTPGCTKQVCFFRDAYEPLTKSGLAIYGLSNDSPKANTTFKTKHNLPYPLLCDPKRTLIKAIGLEKAGGSTQRGVWVVSKDGEVKISEAGGPEATMKRVLAFVEAKA